MDYLEGFFVIFEDLGKWMHKYLIDKSLSDGVKSNLIISAKHTAGMSIKNKRNKDRQILLFICHLY